jgi:hypothetical protein
MEAQPNQQLLSRGLVSGSRTIVFVKIGLLLHKAKWAQRAHFAVLEAVMPTMPSGYVRTTLLSYIAKWA